MFADYVKETGNNDIYINQAHRTYEDQEEIYASKGNDTATIPGCSEHHTGYALDIAVFKPNYQAFNFEGHKKWIPDNCKEYGFILRYPEGKTALTEIKFEPWHYRYVGVPHSVYMTDNNLVLEEYIELLHNYTMNGTHLEITALGKTYDVFYVPANEEGQTTVYVPSDKEYTVSGNNKDGFVVTVDLSEKEEISVEA
jgi:D-alanyl-D-alanine carboxypeptidase